MAHLLKNPGESSLDGTPTVLPRVTVICNHGVWLRFVKSHSSDDHSVGPGLWNLQGLLISRNLWRGRWFDINDLSRIASLQEGLVFSDKPLLNPLLCGAR